jgi:telomere length regulation protein
MMDELLNPIRTTIKIDSSHSHVHEQPQLQQLQQAPKPNKAAISIQTVDDVLSILKNEPDYDSFRAAVYHLSNSDHLRSLLALPSATTSQLVSLLIGNVLPSYWSQMQSHASETELVARVCDCLRTIPAFSLSLNRLKVLIAEAEQRNKTEKKAFLQSNMACVIDILELLMSSDSFVPGIWHNLSLCQITESQRAVAWKEFCSIIASGKVISLVAQADIYLDGFANRPKSWLGTGKQYAAWLARNLATMSKKTAAGPASLKSCSGLLAASFSLGYAGTRSCPIAVLSTAC